MKKLRIDEFIETKVKKLNEEELIDLVYENQEDIIEYAVKFAHNNKYSEKTEKLYKILSNKKVAKAVKYIAKKEKLEKGFVYVINNLITNISRGEEYDGSIVETYSKIVKNLLNEDAKKISKKTGIDKQIVIDLLMVIPEEKYRNSEKHVRIFVQKVLRKLYMLAKDQENIITEPEQIAEFFKRAFGKKLIDIIAIYVLLERKEVMEKFNDSQKAVFNIITVFALDQIESEKKKHIKKSLTEYVRIRKDDDKRGRDAARRINLLALNDDEHHENIVKVVEKMKADEDIAKYL